MLCDYSDNNAHIVSYMQYFLDIGINLLYTYTEIYWRISDNRHTLK